MVDVRDARRVVYDILGGAGGAKGVWAYRKSASGEVAKAIVKVQEVVQKIERSG